MQESPQTKKQSKNNSFCYFSTGFEIVFVWGLSCIQLRLMSRHLALSSHLGAILGPTLGHHGPILGHLGVILGHLGPSWGYLGRLGAILGSSWSHLWAIFGHFEASWGQDAVQEPKYSFSIICLKVFADILQRVYAKRSFLKVEAFRRLDC